MRFIKGQVVSIADAKDDKHYEEIEDIRYELQEQWIVTTDIQSDLKNYYAWLSFEQRAYEIYNKVINKE